MKQKPMLAAIALMASVFAPVANLAGNHPTYATGEATCSEENTANSDNLQDKITAGGTVCIASALSSNARLEVPKDITIIFENNGSVEVTNDSVFNIAANVNAHFTGNGSIKTTSGNSIRADQAAVVTVDENITLKSEKAYGIGIVKNSTTATSGTINFAGIINAPYGMSINGSIIDPVTVNIADGATIQTSGSPIYAAGAGNWTIGKANLTGTTAIGIKSGSITMNGTTVEITGEYYATEAPALSSNGIALIYSSVFQLEHNTPPYTGDIKINLNGGTYTSKSASIFMEYGSEGYSPAPVAITSGTFKAAKEILQVMDAEANLSPLTGGTFTGTDIASLPVADGYEMTISGNTGTVAKKVAAPSQPDDDQKQPEENTTVTSKDGTVTVEGDFGDDEVTVVVEKSEQEIKALEDKTYALFDINLLDENGVKYNFDGTVTVSIKVPAGIDGTKSGIYYVKNDGTLAEKLKSTYKNGVIAFQTTHFSYYAIVEDNGEDLSATANIPSSGIVSLLGGDATFVTSLASVIALGAISLGSGAVAYRAVRRARK